MSSSGGTAVEGDPPSRGSSSACSSSALPPPTSDTSSTENWPSSPPKVPSTPSKQPGVSVESTQKYRFRVLALVLIFLLSLAILLVVYTTFPHLSPEDRAALRLPRNMSDAKSLGTLLSRYKSQHYFHVLLALSLIFIFLQTFAIPGSIFLSILSGYLYPFYQALPLVCWCSACGASLCYLLSLSLGRPLILRFFPNRLHRYSAIISRHRGNLLNYLIFLRVTPFLPNWFINITSPVLGVPLGTFFLGTFLGVAPPSFVCIQAGTTLHTLTSSKDAVSWTSILLLIALGSLSLLPVLLKQRLRAKFEKQQ